MGVACHIAFTLAIAAMIWAMLGGMQHALGRVAPAWRWIANTLLLAQFVLPHSYLLSRRGSRALGVLAPRATAPRMASTSYVLVAAVQTLLLFGLWTPSGVVWWRAQGVLLALLTGLYAGSWLLLLKAIVEAGFALQTGLLGWRAVVRDRAAVYPPMPTRGLFRWVRQPIYLSFALTTWTVPVWTPDQLAVAVTLTAYCMAGPLLKEARFRTRFGAAFEAYCARTPYFLPLPVRWRTRR